MNEVMTTERGTERWSIVQAALWARTRDLDKVESLTWDSRLSDGPRYVPNWEAALACVKGALRDGRLAGQDEEGEYLGQEFWNPAPALHDGDKGIDAPRPYGLGRKTISLSSRDCMQVWPSPMSLLQNGPHSIREVLRQLDEWVAPEVSISAIWFLTHPDVQVVGLNAAGVIVEVPRTVLKDGKIDRGRALVEIEHGDIQWHHVQVALQPNTERPAIRATPPAAQAEKILPSLGIDTLIGLPGIRDPAIGQTGAIADVASPTGAGSRGEDDPAVWLIQEIGRRRSAPEPGLTDRETMEVALGVEFPGLRKLKRRELIRAIPDSLKGRPGRKRTAKLR